MRMARESDEEEQVIPTPADGTDEKRAISKEMKTQLARDLLRGVPLQVALSGWGHHFGNPGSGMFSVDPKNYELSRETEFYHAFISHDWASSRLLKVLSLLIMFNSAPAFYASLATSVLVGLSRAYGLLPDRLWTTALVHLVLLIVFFWWQRIRTLACRPFMIFIDKLCIAQHDEELKQKGILGLAGFLLSSRKLVVLWSPRYFSRLWCTFEIATFLKDPENRKHIEFMPLKTAGLLCLNAICWHLLSICFRVFMLNPSDPRPVGWMEAYEATEDPNFTGSATMFSLGGAATLLVCVIVLPLVSYQGIKLIRDIEELPRQLFDFRVQDASCFCCSNNHQHPLTGDLLPCDRRLVFKTLKKWYGKEKQNDGAGSRLGEDYLDAFNRLVQEELAPGLVAGMGGSTLPFCYTIYMVSACNAPFLANYVSTWVSRLQTGDLSGLAFFIWTLRHFMDWSMASIGAVFAVRVSLIFWRVAVTCRRPRLVSLLLAPWVILCLCGLIFFPFQIILSRTSEDNPLPILPWSAALCATLYVFAPSRKGQERVGRSERSEAEAAVEPQIEIKTAEEDVESTFRI